MKQGIENLNKDQKRLWGAWLIYADILAVAKIHGLITDEEFDKDLKELERIMDLLMPFLPFRYD